MLGTGIAAAVGGLLGVASPGRAAQRVMALHLARGAPQPARNIIFMVSDGMSTGTLTLADTLHRKRHDRPCNWVSLFSRAGARRSITSTHCLGSLVTDSAAAASAWGTGRKYPSGSLNLAPGMGEREPILVTAARTGRSTGLVTTTRVTHATPAGFLVNVRNRDLNDEIADQMIDRLPEVLLGGGAKHFPQERLARAQGATVVRTADELREAAEVSGKLIGLFMSDHMSYAVERQPHEPDLMTLSRIALDRLDRNPDGFVLQIEGGRVDHAAHNNDAPSIVADQLEFDAAIGTVLNWIGERDDTLLVVTTDHGNANPGMTVYHGQSISGLDRLAEASHSFEWIESQCKQRQLWPERSAGATPTPIDSDRMDRILDVIRTATHIDLDDDEKRLLADVLVGRRVTPFGALNNFNGVLGGVLANHYGVSFISGNHTSDHVETTAIGPGSETLEPVTDNVDLHRLMLVALSQAASVRG